MTEQEQRIAIAEACGLQPICLSPEGVLPAEYATGHKGNWFAPDAADKVRRTYKGCAAPKVIPDYLNDLNAMHEAEKTLDESQRTKFYWELAKIVLGDNVPLNCTFLLVHATAAQRAEAFLRTLGKWPSSPLRESE